MRSRRSESRSFFPPMSRAFHELEPGLAGTEFARFLPNTSPDVSPGKQPGATFLPGLWLSTGRLSMPSAQWRTEAMPAAMPNGTDVMDGSPGIATAAHDNPRAVSMIAVRNIACRSIIASPRQGRCCVCVRVDPTLEMICCSGRRSANRIGKSDECRKPWLRCKGPTQSSDSAGETQPTATKAVRRPKKAIATPWRPPMEANRAG